ncbi:GAF and ANTAR domain-containing protein [Amycolatopsis carbonis]|uniref:GAF and ANTAR domain-containing protein n=1 Tax=Amycolatopsis carbonis TaxID=715471 RepID=A0A9Y2I9F3_9PSEU|nr:GAF and ANTAR domain-containing protein [Amycolatopsis sp. 2-15]WIX75439.1 GAF and ANTAR domain-containing protein [Amycolatopsis sp. 2-15]
MGTKGEMGEVAAVGDRERRMIRTFVSMADTLVDEYDVTDLLDILAQRCVELLEVGAAGLMLADERGSLEVRASSTEQDGLRELVKLGVDEGPGVACFRSGVAVHATTIGADSQRWPRFAAAARRAGFASVHSLPLRLRGLTIGALNLFGRANVPAEDLELAQGLADTATIGILQERAIRRGEVLSDQLQSALSSRVVIEQAKGVLSISGRLSMADAFTALRQYARSHNTRLGEVARSLAEGELDPAVVLTRVSGKN